MPYCTVQNGQLQGWCTRCSWVVSTKRVVRATRNNLWQTVQTKDCFAKKKLSSIFAEGSHWLDSECCVLNMNWFQNSRQGLSKRRMKLQIESCLSGTKTKWLNAPRETESLADQQQNLKGFKPNKKGQDCNSKCLQRNEMWELSRGVRCLTQFVICSCQHNKLQVFSFMVVLCGTKKTVNVATIHRHRVQDDDWDQCGCLPSFSHQTNKKTVKGRSVLRQQSNLVFITSSWDPQFKTLEGSCFLIQQI